MSNDRVIFHIDANSAYISWEAAYRLQHGIKLDLRDVPSVVGGDIDKRKGIVLTKSIPAKKCGIKTGEGLYTARVKCPELIVVPPNYSLYLQCSNAMTDIIRSYSPFVQRYSVDECFADLSNINSREDAIKTAYELKDKIKNELGFTVNIGVSTNKLLAKMASEFEKPNKVHTLFPDEIEHKMFPLHVSELFMVGRATVPKLVKKGINTIGDLAHSDVNLLKQWLKSYGAMIWNYANGVEDSPVRNSAIPMKGIGNSTTIPFDVDDIKTASLILLSLVETVAMRLRSAKHCTKVIAVSLKTSDFNYKSHQRKLYSSTCCTNTIYEKAYELMNELWDDQPIRHIGVRLSELCTNDFHQLSFFDNIEKRQQALDKAVDSIRYRYGAGSIVRSCFVRSGLSPLSGGTSDGDYIMMSSIL